MTEKSTKVNWVNVVMFFSLALNFFIVGYFVSDSKIFRKLHDRKIFHKRPEIRIVDYFPHTEKVKFRKYMLDHRIELMPVQRNIANSQKEIFQIISQEKVVETELRKAFQKYQKNNSSLQSAINEMVIEMIMEMSYETRLKIINRGKKSHERWRLMRQKWQKEKETMNRRATQPPDPSSSP